MEKPSHEQVKELLGEVVLPFYDVNRDMLIPTQPRGERRFENDAEHSWSLAVIACSLAPHIDPDLDIGLVSQFAIVHDLVEVYADDTSIWADKTALDSKQANEEEALDRIKAKFSHFPWLVETLEKYEQQDTPEALYIRSIDKYVGHTIRLLDEGEAYTTLLHITKEMFEAVTEAQRHKVEGHLGAAEYYGFIIDDWMAHPEYFHQDSSSLATNQS